VSKENIFLCLATLAAALAAFVPLPAPAGEPAEHNFQVRAEDFAFSPASLRVNPGDIVTIELFSADFVHGLHVDVYGLEVTAEPGQPGRLTFVADRPGSFRLRCSVSCGALHPFMIGRFEVGPNLFLLRGAALLLLVAGIPMAYRAAKDRWKSPE
jgi:heme/copper-type cytochrome/quinol oxidase subunit 2